MAGLSACCIFIACYQAIQNIIVSIIARQKNISQATIYLHGVK